MTSDPQPDPDPAPPEWQANDRPAGTSGNAPSGRRRIRRQVRHPADDPEGRWERHGRSTRRSGRSTFPSHLSTGIICFALGMLTTWFLLHPPFRVDPPAPNPSPESLVIDPAPKISTGEIREWRERAIETHRKAEPIIEAFLSPSMPDNIHSLLRPTPGMQYNLSRYGAERTRLARLERTVPTRITAKGSFTGFPVAFAGGETRTAWFEHVGDDELLLDLDSFLGCGDLTLLELEQSLPTEPARVRGFGRILPRERGASEEDPDILALRDAPRNTLLLLQIDRHSGISPAIRTTLRKTTGHLPILLDAARSPSPSARSSLRVVKIHALHWLYVPGFELAPAPHEARPDTQ
jgi:hypothetical protein